MQGIQNITEAMSHYIHPQYKLCGPWYRDISDNYTLTSKCVTSQLNSGLPVPMSGNWFPVPCHDTKIHIIWFTQ